jgi:hypothetical protein
MRQNRRDTDEAELAGYSADRCMTSGRQIRQAADRQEVYHPGTRQARGRSGRRQTGGRQIRQGAI